MYNAAIRHSVAVSHSLYATHMKTRHSVLLILFGLITHFAVSQDRKTVKFINNYLNSAFWTVQGNNQPLLKWKDKIDTIEYKLVGELSYLSEKSWKKYLLEIESLTRKVLTETKTNDYKILIFFGELKDYASLTGNQIPLNASREFNNWSSRNWDGNYNLTKASYCIVPSKIKDSNHGTYHLKKGILKSLGILGEVDNEYSIFYKYSTSSNINLSREDKRIVKLHYNQAVESGMDKLATKETIMEIENIVQLSKEKL